MDMGEEDEEDLESSQDVEAVAYFVGNSAHEFPAGSEATALISFDNQGTGAYDIQTIEGSFRFPQDFRYFLQNFTVDNVGVTVPAGEQVGAALAYESVAMASCLGCAALACVSVAIVFSC